MQIFKVLKNFRKYFNKFSKFMRQTNKILQNKKFEKTLEEKNFFVSL